MDDLTQYRGYRNNFLGPAHRVAIPRLRSHLRKAVAPVAGSRNDLLHYQHFSLIQHAHRRFPILTAANIDGQLFKTLPRTDRWRLDPRLAPEHQWGNELYRAPMSHFDRGHMTKREDVQWGQSEAEASRGADSTFFFTNAVPQVPGLNRQLWRGLEDYILKSETVDRDFRIVLLTGPVLAEDDPVFVTPVAGQQVRIPTLFWKVIYFTKSDGRLYRVGFLMGQEELLEKEKIVHPRPDTRDFDTSEEAQLFMQFKGADIYQVNIRTIAKLAGLIFPAAEEPFRDDRPQALIRREVQARGGFGEDLLGFEIDGLQL